MSTLANTFGIAACNFTAYPEMPNARALVEYGMRVEELDLGPLEIALRLGYGRRT